MAEFHTGDVVYVVCCDVPRGFAVVAGIEPGEINGGVLLKLHSGRHLDGYHYVHSGWCHPVGRAGPAALARAEESDAFDRRLREERMARVGGRL